MAKYMVQAKEIVFYDVEVEADSPGEAMAKVKFCEVETKQEDITDGDRFEVTGCYEGDYNSDFIDADDFDLSVDKWLDEDGMVRKLA